MLKPAPFSSYPRYQRIILLIAAAPFFALFGYGIVFFADAPIHPCGIDQFCGKGGYHHTMADYQAFLIWQNRLGWAGFVGLVLNVIFWAIRKIAAFDAHLGQIDSLEDRKITEDDAAQGPTI